MVSLRGYNAHYTLENKLVRIKNRQTTLLFLVVEQKNLDFCCVLEEIHLDQRGFILCAVAIFLTSQTEFVRLSSMLSRSAQSGGVSKC